MQEIHAIKGNAVDLLISHHTVAPIHSGSVAPIFRSPGLLRAKQMAA
jgi:hypothetical protein